MRNRCHHKSKESNDNYVHEKKNRTMCVCRRAALTPLNKQINNSRAVRLRRLPITRRARMAWTHTGTGRRWQRPYTIWEQTKTMFTGGNVWRDQRKYSSAIRINGRPLTTAMAINKVYNITQTVPKRNLDDVTAGDTAGTEVSGGRSTVSYNRAKVEIPKIQRLRVHR